MPELSSDLKRNTPSISTAAIALGSNLPSIFGNPQANLREAVKRLEILAQIVTVSSFYETEPVGYAQQPRFINAAVILATDLAPLELLRGLLRIEREMGRDRSADAPAKGPRIIDLDLLLYGSTVLDSTELMLPHPEMARRRFVLEPLSEIAPDLQHPILNRTVRELLESLPD